MNYPEFLMVEKLDVIDSTNSYIKRNLSQFKSKFPLLVIAREQTQGRGREDRQWFSPAEKGLYASYAMMLNRSLSVQLLSLVAGIAVVDTLQEINSAPFCIKWPNDVYVQGRKVAGVLIENVFFQQEIVSICGIGLNINADDFPMAIEKKAISLKMLAPNRWPIESIAMKLSHHLFQGVGLLSQGRHNEIVARANEYNRFMIDKPIAFQQGEQSIYGICRGIDPEGGLILEDSYGKKNILFDGEIRIVYDQ